MKIPEQYKDLVGTKQIFSGGLFSRRIEIEETEFNVLAWRWGSAKIIDMKTMKQKHPTIEFLVKREGMRASRWTRPFPVKEINLKDDPEDY